MVYTTYGDDWGMVKKNVFTTAVLPMFSKFAEFHVPSHKKKTPLSATLRGPVTQWHVHLGESSPSTADEKVCFFDDFFPGLFYHVVEYPLKIVFFMLMDIQHQKNGL